MNYYGKKNMKSCYALYEDIKDILDPLAAIGHVYAEGKIKGYLSKLDKAGTSCYPKDSNNNYDFINTENVVDIIKDKENTYYIVRKEHRGYSGNKEYSTEFYKALDPVGNGGSYYYRDFGKYEYNWKRNKKYNTLEMTVIRGKFEYTCIHRDSGDGTIDVRYTGCDNKHRNNVTISRINLIKPTNLDYMEAIRKWVDDFRCELSHPAA